MIVSATFFGLLVGSAVVYWLIPRQYARKVFLCLVSLVFIALLDRFAAVVVVALALFTTAAGALIGKTRKTVYHRLGVVGLALVLVAFKYLGLLEETVDDFLRFVNALPCIEVYRLVLPLGISYITFKFISYLTDVHWRIVEPAGFVDVLCYGSLFTIFVAGPIERFGRLAPQLREPAPRFSWPLVEEGLLRIAVGLFKKLVVADWVGFFTAPVWKSPGEYTIAMQFLALLGYSVQIYMDFAGYSDIAIGASGFFGLRIMENFNWPYLQPNISKFWQCWHISLSEWIRDYVFFPLSRLSRNGFYTVVVVPLVAMGLCGLWHGPAWHFALWGLWHGAGIAVLQIWNAQKRQHRALAQLARSRVFNVLSTLATFLFVTVGWLWFRS